jgi:mannuronan 5-epimerase
MRLAVGLGCWSTALVAMAAPAVPTPEEIAALVEAVLEAPLPKSVPGEIAVTAAADERDLGRGFLDDLEALPNWPGLAIVVQSGTHRLEAVAATIDRPDLLHCAEAACRLAGPLLVAEGAALVIDRHTVSMLQESGGLLSAAGDLWISDSVILGWHEGSDAPAATDPEARRFRPWIAGLEANRTFIRGSRLAHLGYDSNSTQGLAFTTADRAPPAGRPRVDIVTSRIEDLYYGFFTWEAEGVRLLRNEFEGNHLYGIDPHDATRDMLIAENFVRDTKYSHGLVMSREIHDTVVTRNRSINNAGAGFFLDKGSWNVTFAGNESFDNGTDGITVYESRNVSISDNHVAGNGRAGIRIRASADIAIEDNIVHHNAGPGIFVYDWSHASREPDAEDEQYMQPTSVTITGNRLADNDSGDCSLQGEVTVIGISDC